jgi:uncharacterized protein (DUF1810 family)
MRGHAGDGLVRFVMAQDPVFPAVVAELRAGRKQSHWMWFVFPQLAGLGFSDMARRYAIPDLAGARDYLADPVLGPRLREVTRLMLGHAGRSAREILGTPDDMKFHSSMTLFRAAATDAADIALFQQALDGFFGGDPDRQSLQLLRPQAHAR